MGIGVSVLLMAAGAILTFALERSVSGINLDAVGIILMLAGALGLIMTVFVWSPRRRSAAHPGGEMVEERRVYEERPPL